MSQRCLLYDVAISHHSLHSLFLKEFGLQNCSLDDLKQTSFNANDACVTTHVQTLMNTNKEETTNLPKITEKGAMSIVGAQLRGYVVRTRAAVTYRRRNARQLSHIWTVALGTASGL